MHSPVMSPAADFARPLSLSLCCKLSSHCSAIGRNKHTPNTDLRLVKKVLRHATLQVGGTVKANDLVNHLALQRL